MSRSHFFIVAYKTVVNKVNAFIVQYIADWLSVDAHTHTVCLVAAISHSLCIGVALSVLKRTERTQLTDNTLHALPCHSFSRFSILLVCSYESHTVFCIEKRNRLFWYPQPWLVHSFRTHSGVGTIGVQNNTLLLSPPLLVYSQIHTQRNACAIESLKRLCLCISTAVCTFAMDVQRHECY